VLAPNTIRLQPATRSASRTRELARQAIFGMSDATLITIISIAIQRAQL
jgi:hypothetical protein